jgi:hypothetical protein
MYCFAAAGFNPVPSAAAEGGGEHHGAGVAVFELHVAAAPGNGDAEEAGPVLLLVEGEEARDDRGLVRVQGFPPPVEGKGNPRQIEVVRQVVAVVLGEIDGVGPDVEPVFHPHHAGRVESDGVGRVVGRVAVQGADVVRAQVLFVDDPAGVKGRRQPQDKYDDSASDKPLVHFSSLCFAVWLVVPLVTAIVSRNRSQGDAGRRKSGGGR